MKRLQNFRGLFECINIANLSVGTYWVVFVVTLLMAGETNGAELKRKNAELERKNAELERKNVELERKYQELYSKQHIMTPLLGMSNEVAIPTPPPLPPSGFLPTFEHQTRRF